MQCMNRKQRTSKCNSLRQSSLRTVAICESTTTTFAGETSVESGLPQPACAVICCEANYRDRRTGHVSQRPLRAVVVHVHGAEVHASVFAVLRCDAGRESTHAWPRPSFVCDGQAPQATTFECELHSPAVTAAVAETVRDTYSLQHTNNTQGTDRAAGVSCTM